jgi:tetratricopeptide (TPR) repeat protein
MPGRFAKVCLLFALGSVGGCALSAGPVTRVADGVERDGRPVSEEAYAYYARGVAFETKGDAGAALSSYRAALREDPDSAELYARVGSVECGRSLAAGDEAARRAQESFARALELDPTSSSAWSLSARCAARGSRHREALRAAQKAVEFDPSSVAFSLLVVEYAEAVGDLPTARRWLDGLLASAPTSREALRASAAFAKRHGERGRQLSAERTLAERFADTDDGEALHAALARADLRAAQRAALRLRIPTAELALRAARESRASLASETAELALALDPNDSDAWIAALAAADLGGDRARVDQLLDESPPLPSPASPLGLELLSELLARLAGDDARAAWEHGHAQASKKAR